MLFLMDEWLLYSWWFEWICGGWWWSWWWWWCGGGGGGGGAIWWSWMRAPVINLLPDGRLPSVGRLKTGRHNSKGKYESIFESADCELISCIWCANWTADTQICNQSHPIQSIPIKFDEIATELRSENFPRKWNRRWGKEGRVGRMPWHWRRGCRVGKWADESDGRVGWVTSLRWRLPSLHMQISSSSSSSISLTRALHQGRRFHNPPSDESQFSSFQSH